MPPGPPSKICHGGKAKVKSGCRTCKLRKIKCDEGYPACRRCVSTGRACDGYGIWGGGGHVYGSRQHPAFSQANSIAPRPSDPEFLLASAEEAGYFDWFKVRTSIKLPGSFFSDFWAKFVIQASVNEPAVWHAVLALSSVHKNGVLRSQNEDNSKLVSEQFTLHHYGKAISHLQPHFAATKDKRSIRVALITCMVFVSLEVLREHFITAKIHLASGLRLLQETLSVAGGIAGPLLMPSREAIDNSIVEAFSRIKMQIDLFKHIYEQPGIMLETAIPHDRTGSEFTSVKEAWVELQGAMSRIFNLTTQARDHTAEFATLPYPHSIPERQQSIIKDLSRWRHSYEASMHELLGQNSIEERKMYGILPIYHTMAEIMANTSLSPGDEMAFDNHTEKFMRLITQLVEMRVLSGTIYSFLDDPHRLLNMGRSVMDVGSIPPLYYVAIKCRVHRVRLQAVRLLESTEHREGFWDGKIVGTAARKVMEFEERDYYQCGSQDEDFSIASYPTPPDLTMSTLPNKYRLREVELILTGEPAEKISLVCTQRRGDRDCRVRIADYDRSSNHWIDLQ